MHGCGEFHHRDGHVLAPAFKNNLFCIPNSNGASIVPFKREVEISQYINKIKDHNDRVNKQATAKEEKVNLHRIMDGASLAPTLQAIRKSGRTPLICSSFENPSETENIRAHMDISDPQMDNYLFLRTLGLEME